MSIVLDKYKIDFYRRPFKNSVTGVTTVNKIMESSIDENYIITSFFDDYVISQEIQEGILDIIENVKNNIIEEGETGSQSGIAVYISNDTSRFIYFNGTGTYLSPDLSIPTSEFEQIAIEWQSFVNS